MGFQDSLGLGCVRDFFLTSSDQIAGNVELSSREFGGLSCGKISLWLGLANLCCSLVIISLITLVALIEDYAVHRWAWLVNTLELPKSLIL